METITRKNSNNPTWEEILGENNWEGLLEPKLDVSLRDLIFRCGDFCETIIDAFIPSDSSPRRGESRFPISSFFHDVNTLQNPNNYQLVAFLNCPSGRDIAPVTRSSKNEVNMTGYVAVTTDQFSREIGRREIYVVWRGTMRNSEWINNILDSLDLEKADVLLADRRNTDGARFRNEFHPRVQAGWLNMYTSNKLVGTSARDQLWAVIKELRQKYDNDGLKLSVIVTGYSLGAALATLCAFDLAENRVVDENTRVMGVVFGGPHVGNRKFLERFEQLSNLKLLHVKNKGDIIAAVPGDLPVFGDLFALWVGARYVPIETRYLEIDLERSHYLKNIVPESASSVTAAASKDDVLIKLKKSLENLSRSNDPQNLQKSLADIPAKDIDDSKSILDIIEELLGKYFPQLRREYIFNLHNLTATSHLLAYFYEPKEKRSLALLNKWGGLLRDEFRIPELWMFEKNSGMVQVDALNGEWVLDPEPLVGIKRKEENNELEEPVSVLPTWEALTAGTKQWDWKTTLVQEALNDDNSNPSRRTHPFKNFLLQCGNFAQATYDCFNSNPVSHNNGNTRYGKTSFFQEVMLTRPSHYEVYSFLYATPGDKAYDGLFLHPPYPDTETSKAWDREANWIGYVAVTTDEITKRIGRREIYVAWRGTVTGLDSLNSFDSNSIQSIRPDNGNVHKAWFSIYNSSSAKSEYAKKSAKEQLWTIIKELVNKYKGEKEPIQVVITGHSLGGALAVLSAYDLVANGVVDRRTAVWAVVFGSPRVGDALFNQSLGRYSNLIVLPIRNKLDTVPKRPEWLVDLRDPKLVSPAELVVDTKLSSYVDVTTAEEAHNLEVTLHMVAGLTMKVDPTDFDGSRAVVSRSLALVNKYTGCLTEPHNKHVPNSWWGEKDKGMVLNRNTLEWLLDPVLPII